MTVGVVVSWLMCTTIDCDHEFLLEYFNEER